MLIKRLFKVFVDRHKLKAFTKIIYVRCAERILKTLFKFAVKFFDGSDIYVFGPPGCVDLTLNGGHACKIDINLKIVFVNCEAC